MKRILIAIPLFALISFISFALTNHTQKDIAVSVLYSSGIPEITDEMLEKTMTELSLDKPFFTRYWNWIKGCASFDFGNSYIYKRPVGDIIIPSFINTIQLALAAIVVIVMLSLAFGVLCAKYAGGFFDRIIRGVMFILNAMPAYWIGTLLMWGISVKLNLLPTSGKEGPESFILPVFILSVSYFSYYLRLIRGEMIQIEHENYILYGRCCGLKEKVLIKHILKNSLQTTVSAFFLAIPNLLAGTVVVENVFAWPGIGRTCVLAIFRHDIPVIQAYVLILAVSFVSFNLFADIINAAINPRLRES
ncbi:MAG: ABC transporter permease [Treponema sp.]|jgi:nickel transport system permease protein|nr:ABC transporter permease [Treponema sp.]